jgi:dTDP-4-amino-4,6-dideoxygalactose transaminase
MNGTAGPHIAQKLSDIHDGDHVIVPNITFIATLNAITYTGATPILVDADPETWQLDINLLEDFLENNTYLVESCIGVNSTINVHYIRTHKPIKAIIPVLVLGNMCDMDRLIQLAAKYHLTVIEYCTKSLGRFFESKHSGSFGRFGVFSFNGNKIISTGGGGVIVTDNENLAKKAKHLMTQAKSSAMEYIHDEISYNYHLINILAAVDVGRMDMFPECLSRKHAMDANYRQELKGIGEIVFLEVSPDAAANCWLFTFKDIQDARIVGIPE